MPIHTVAIELDRLTKTYQQGESLTGTVVIENKHDLKHDGVVLLAEGFVDLHFNLRGVSFMDTFYGTNKEIPLMAQAYQLSAGGKFAPGVTKLPFRVTIDSLGDLRQPLYETYHGVFISIQVSSFQKIWKPFSSECSASRLTGQEGQYFIRCQVRRPFLAKDIQETVEFIVEYDPSPIGAPATIANKQALKFHITPESLCAPTRRDAIPDFSVVGNLDSSIFRLSEPITGEFVIEKCESIIRSVELQLVRIETCGLTPGDRDYSRDATEVQNIQLGDGNLLRQLPVPIYMILPRVFTCPTLITSNFKIEFEINLVIIFEDNYLITENFPIKLIRSTLQPIHSI